MALEMQDLMALKSMGNENGMSPYEQVKLDYMASKRPSNAAITGVVLGGGALLIGATAWIFGGLQSNAAKKEAVQVAQAAKEIAIAKNDGLRDLVQTLAGTVAAERAERIAGDTTISQTITDTISGQQSGTQTAQVSQTTAVDQTVQQIMTQTLSDAITGKSSLNPTPVTIYSAPAPCGCPGCGCGQ